MLADPVEAGGAEGAGAGRDVDHAGAEDAELQADAALQRDHPADARPAGHGTRAQLRPPGAV